MQLRSTEIGIPIRDLDLLTIDLVLDMRTEKANDGVKYARVADQYFTIDPIIIISSIVVVIGGLMVTVRVLRMIIMFPKWIIVHIKRILKQF